MNDHKPRCAFCLKDPLYIAYHDEEWSAPLHQEERHFEMLLLETMQAGLNWWTILRRREGFRRAFADFDAVKIALFNEEDVHRLLQNSDIIRHEGKIRAAIQNAQVFEKIQTLWGSYDAFIWSFTDGAVISSTWETAPAARSALSERVNKAMRQLGFVFVGSVTVQAYLQAIGVLHEHWSGCFLAPENAK